MSSKNGHDVRMNRPPWPTAAQYREAVADRDALGRADLRNGRLELGSGGVPKSYDGTFSTTFHFTTADGDVAFRCFKGGDDPRRRYAAIAELLRYVRNDALCWTEFEPEAIRVDGTPWPAVIMEWIAGRSLDAEVAVIVADDGGGDALMRLAMQFREVVRSLDALGIAHGDLQHGNILVADGRLRLIDYDAMYLPAIADLVPSEYGHRNYQHPQRRDAPFDRRLDRFSALVIYTALVALASDRSLWTRFHDGENLLFRAHDFTSNGRSDLFRDLLSNNATNGLADVLRAACALPASETPSLEEAIAASASTMSAHAFVAPPKPRQRPSRAVIPPLRVAAATTPAPTLRGRSLPLVIFALGLIGLAIGVGAAAFHRGSVSQIATRVRPTFRATHVPNVAVVPVTTAVPSETPTSPAPKKKPTSRPTPPPTRVATSDMRGTWQIAEANVRVGTIVWTGAAFGVSGATYVLDARKTTIAGRSATLCERQTTLHAELAIGVARQTVPYRETNCTGATSYGELRVNDFGSDAGSFTGSVWQGGSKIGDFTASKG